MAYNIAAADYLSRQGISLSTYSAAGYSDSKIANLIDGAVALDANYVVLGNVNLVDLASNHIGEVIDNGLHQTAPLADVARAISLAQAAGLDVVLKPQLAVIDPAYDQYNSASWINMVNPDLKITDPAGFFRSYKAMILEWATMAQKYGVDTLCIGNEMVAATKPEYTSYWIDIIAAVRKVYDGNLTYAALAPVMTNSASNEITQIGFWDKLDYAGFDVFPSLTHDRSPTVEELKAGWYDTTVYGHRQNYVAFLEQMAEHVGKPVVFAETGLPSFDGASDREATSDGMIGNGSRAADQQEQADWWQAFFEVWADKSPAWLKGVYAINNDPGYLGSFYEQNYNINGKLAEGVVASWFGGRTIVGATATKLAGSQGDDQLYLYDPAISSGGKLGNALTTVVEVVVTGSLIDGQTPTLRAIINGHDFGALKIGAFDSGYVSPDGVRFTINSTFTLELQGLVKIDELKLVYESAEGDGATAFYHSIAVNGVALTGGQYYPSAGHGGPYDSALPRNGEGGNSGQWAGGYTLFDASPWNAWLAADQRGTQSNPFIVEGNVGNDVLHVLGRKSDYTITKTGEGAYRLTEKAGLSQNALLSGIETIVFSDGKTTDLVAKPNDAPVVQTALADQAADEGAAWRYQVSANAFNDVNGDALTYSASLANGGVLPAWLAFDAVSRTFTGTAPAGFSDVLDLRVTASDGSLSASDSFTLTVRQVNKAPALASPIADQALAANVGWSYQIPAGAFHDVDGDRLSYSATRVDGNPLPSWLSFDATTRTFSGRPPAGFSGAVELEVTASDGIGSASDGFRLTVAAPISSPAVLPDDDSQLGWRLLTKPGFHGEIGGSGLVYGSNGFEDITLLDQPGTIVFDGSFNRGGDVVRLQGDASDWSVRIGGSGVTLLHDDTAVVIPVGIVGMTVGFADGTLELRYDAQQQKVMIGDQAVTDRFIGITSAPEQASLMALAGDGGSALLFVGPATSVTLGGDYRVFGTLAAEDLHVNHGSIHLDPSFGRGVDLVELDGAAAQFSATLDGSFVSLTSATIDIDIPVGVNPMTVRFNDGDRALVYDSTLQAVMIGSQVLDGTSPVTFA